MQDIEEIWDEPAYAAAQAIADAAGECTSTGKAFGCAKAESQAAAWASAAAEAHAHAYAEAFNGCGACDPNTALQTEAAAESLASTFIELIVDVYARAEVNVCVQGDQSSSAEAWSNCFAKAFTRLNAKAVADSLVAGACQYAQVEVFVRTVTSATYTDVSGCEQGDRGSGNGSGDTSGSAAESVRVYWLLLQPDLSRRVLTRPMAPVMPVPGPVLGRMVVGCCCDCQSNPSPLLPPHPASQYSSCCYRRRSGWACVDNPKLEQEAIEGTHEYSSCCVAYGAAL